MRPNLRLLFVLPRKFPGTDAASKHVSLLARGLEELGHEVRVLGSPPSAASREGASLVTRLSNHLLMPTRTARAAAAAVDEQRPDAIITYGQSFHGLAPILRLAKRKNRPLFVITTEIWTFSPDIALFSLDNLLYRKLTQPRIAGVLAISREILADAARSGVPGFPLPALADTSHPPVKAQGDGWFNLVYVGPLFRRDLPGALLEGFSRFHARHPKSRLIVAGNVMSTKDGRKFARDVAASPVLAGCVEIAGWVSDARLREIMSEASAFVILRQDDLISRACFPFRLAGFMMTARPVILSAVGEPARLYADKAAAFHVPPGSDPDALCDVLALVAGDPELAARVGAAGRLACKAAQDYRTCSEGVAQFIANTIDR